MTLDSRELCRRETCSVHAQEEAQCSPFPPLCTLCTLRRACKVPPLSSLLLPFPRLLLPEKHSTELEVTIPRRLHEPIVALVVALLKVEPCLRGHPTAQSHRPCRRRPVRRVTAPTVDCVHELWPHALERPAAGFERTRPHGPVEDVDTILGGQFHVCTAAAVCSWRYQPCARLQETAHSSMHGEHVGMA
jgi:hypothetical protein